MGNVIIFREYNLILSMLRWRVYVNGKMVAKVGNCRMATFSLSSGAYDIFVNCPDILPPFRKKGLHSNVIHLKVDEEGEYYFKACPHPLFATKKHYPGMIHLFTPVECLLLLRQDNNCEENINRLRQIGMDIQLEYKKFKYHPVSLVLIITLSLFAMISNIRHPDLYATGDGIAWGILFGFSNLIGLFSGRMNKQMMAMGWEYKLMLYTAFSALMILVFMPQPYHHWQGTLYFISLLLFCYWAYFCYKRWKEKRKGLDNIDKQERVLEQGF